MKLLILLLLAVPLYAEPPQMNYVGVLQLTSYQPVAEQTDATPFLTSIAHLTHPFGVAISQDLLRLGVICYGDVILVDGYGLYVVNDVMGAYTYRSDPPVKQERAVDILVMGRQHEALIGVQHRQVWAMRSPVRACNREEAISMGMVNAKKIRKALENFKKQHGREPSQEEFRDMLAGRLAKAAHNVGKAK